MRLFNAALVFLLIKNASAFIVVRQAVTSPSSLLGYLDDISKDLSSNERPDDEESKEMTDMAKEKLDRYGPGDFSQFKVC